MKIIFFLLLTFSVFCQSLLIETFSDFSFNETDADLVYLYRLTDSTTAFVDQTGNGYTLSGIANPGDSVTALTSIITDGGSNVYLNGSSQYYTIDNAGVIKTNDFSVVVKEKLESTGADEYFFGYRYARWRVTATTTSYNYQYYNGSTFVGGATNAVMQDTAWHVVVWTKTSTGGTGGRLYIDNVKRVDRDQDTTAIVTFDNKMYIGATYGAAIGFPALGWIQEVFAIDRVLTAKEIAEITYLAKNWTSPGNDTTGAIRDNWGFFQGINNDTIYYTNFLNPGGWSISIKDSAASEINYSILTSADAKTWSTLANGMTGTSWNTNNYAGTGFCYIGIAVPSGTAFFDDLIVILIDINFDELSTFDTFLK